MKNEVMRRLTSVRETFAGYTSGQKATVVVGGAAVLLAAFMAFRWASAPSYTPLFSGLSSQDASAVVEELDAAGTPYEITDGGGTILVPDDVVHRTRITLSGEGIPSSDSEGYSILDKQGVAASDFKEQTDYKRAMEGELTNTIESLDSVDTATVHLALPEKVVFAAEQQPATASVLVKPRRGEQLAEDQVQAIVHLVASSVDGLKPDKVTVTDSSGQVLSTSDGTSQSGSGAQMKQVDQFQESMRTRVQTMLDRVLGPGNSQVQVTADLDFDKSVSETTRYFRATQVPALSETTKTETYQGTGGAGGSTGVVGPDGQMEDNVTGANGDGNGSYTKSERTSDNAIDKTVEQREQAPGAVRSLHVGVVLDSVKQGAATTAQVSDLIAATIGTDEDRGDTIEVSSMAFDRSGEQAAAEELAAAEAAERWDRIWDTARTAGIVLLVAIAILIAWLRNRRNARERKEAADALVEQLRRDQANADATAVSPAVEVVASEEELEAERRREEIAELVEKQPEDVANLLRGWLVERR
jgi:flagellar M-ring protein FliF